MGVQAGLDSKQGELLAALRPRVDEAFDPPYRSFEAFLLKLIAQPEPATPDIERMLQELGDASVRRSSFVPMSRDSRNALSSSFSGWK